MSHDLKHATHYDDRRGKVPGAARERCNVPIRVSNRARHTKLVRMWPLVLSAIIGCVQKDRSDPPVELTTSLPTRPVSVMTSDTDVQKAQIALAEGRAAAASRIVMPVLKVPERRTPEALLVASRAAAEWGGW